jgi:outer membrane lipoprotein carrier protein
MNRVREHRFYLKLAALFDRSPFIALAIAAFLPIPLDGVRLMAITRRYNRFRYAAAAFLGRAPRYAMIASVGFGLRTLGSAGAGMLVPAAAANPPAADVAPADPAPADPALAAILARMDAALVHLKDLHGSFRQERSSPAFPDPERSRGDLWFRRPGDLVLHYVEPADQRMLIDSAGVWIYLVAEKQAQHYPFSSPAERDAALAVLWQPSPMLARLYALSPADVPPKGEPDGTWLRLIPRAEDLASAVAVAHVRLGAKSGLADCVVVDKPDGERVRLEIRSIERNPGVPASRFRFAPPPGVEVVRF